MSHGITGHQKVRRLATSRPQIHGYCSLKCTSLRHRLDEPWKVKARRVSPGEANSSIQSALIKSTWQIQMQKAADCNIFFGLDSFTILPQSTILYLSVSLRNHPIGLKSTTSILVVNEANWLQQHCRQPKRPRHNVGKSMPATYVYTRITNCRQKFLQQNRQHTDTSTQFFIENPHVGNKESTEDWRSEYNWMRCHKRFSLMHTPTRCIHQCDPSLLGLVIPQKNCRY